MKKEWWIPQRKQSTVNQSAIDKRQLHQSFYTSAAWRKFRAYCLTIFPPLCDCGRLITDSRQIHLHHCHPLSTSEGKRLSLSLYDDEGKLNIVVKCWHCHTKADAELRRQLKPDYKSSDEAMKEFEI